MGKTSLGFRFSSLLGGLRRPGPGRSISRRPRRAGTIVGHGRRAQPGSTRTRRVRVHPPHSTFRKLERRAGHRSRWPDAHRRHGNPGTGRGDRSSHRPAGRRARPAHQADCAHLQPGGVHRGQRNLLVGGVLRNRGYEPPTRRTVQSTRLSGAATEPGQRLPRRLHDPARDPHGDRAGPTDRCGRCRSPRR